MPIPLELSVAASPAAEPRGAGAWASQAAALFQQSDPAVRVERLGKRFKLYPRPWGRLTEWLALGRAVRHEDFWALRDVSFTVARGESLGVIGANGSGKSTLLKMLSGALYPTEGDFHVAGRALSLLELGTGLNPELPGRRNVVNSARLLAFPPGYAAARMDDIEAFADLPEGFFDRPVKLYSSGMLVRLVFSMFACFEPDVFIVDEALSVGDVFFQQKCARRLAEMKAGGVTLLFVSHDLAAVEALCDRVVVLHQGRMIHDGDKKKGISLYYARGGEGLGRAAEADGAVGAGASASAGDGAAAGRWCEAPPELDPAPIFAALAQDDVAWMTPDTRDAFGDGAVAFTGIAFQRSGAGAGAGSGDRVARQGEWLHVLTRVDARDEVSALNVGLALHDRTNRLIFARGLLNAGLPPMRLRRGDVMVVRFALKLDLEPDEYILSLAAGEAIADGSNPFGWNQNIGGVRHHELPRAAVVAVTPGPDSRRRHFGPANLESRIDGMLDAHGGGGERESGKEGQE